MWSSQITFHPCLLSASSHHVASKDLNLHVCSRILSNSWRRPVAISNEHCTANFSPFFTLSWKICDVIFTYGERIWLSRRLTLSLCLQDPSGLHGFDLRGRGAPALVPCWDVHFLHCLLRRLPLLLCQHLRRPHHRHFQWTGRGRATRWHGQKPGTTQLKLKTLE